MARKKVYKVKHYRGGYRRRKKSTYLKVFLLVLASAAVFILSYLLLGPLTDLLYNNTVNSSSEQEEKPPVAGSSSEDSVSSEAEAQVISFKTRAITVAELENSESHSALIESVKNDGCTAVILPLKTKDYIYFPTENALAVKTKTVTDVKIGDLIAAFKASGIKVYGEFSVFMDDKLPRMVYGSADMDMAVRFNKNINQLAIDYLTDPADEGGITWLSPESEKTREYITDLARSAAGTGVDGIIFTNYCYTDHANAYFTDKAEFNRAETLLNLSAQIKAAIGDCEMMISGAVGDFNDANTVKFGGNLGAAGDSFLITADGCDDSLTSLLKTLSDKEVAVRLPEVSEDELSALGSLGVKAVIAG